MVRAQYIRIIMMMYYYIHNIIPSVIPKMIITAKLPPLMDSTQGTRAHLLGSYGLKAVTRITGSRSPSSSSSYTHMTFSSERSYPSKPNTGAPNLCALQVTTKPIILIIVCSNCKLWVDLFDAFCVVLFFSYKYYGKS